MPTRIGVLALVLATSAAACSGSDDGSETAPDATALARSSASGVEAFCGEFNSLQGEQPESYVGSAEHLADIEGLLAGSPEPVAGNPVVFRDDVASGANDTEADPESNVTENWPDDVQAAIGGRVDFAQTNC